MTHCAVIISVRASKYRWLNLKLDMNKFYVVLLLLVLACATSQANDADDEDTEMKDDYADNDDGGEPTDYCDPDLCSKGKRHIGCNNNGAFDSNCPKNRTLIPLSEDNIELIVDLHNKYRNKIASGSDPRYQPAARMSTVVRGTNFL